MTFYKLSPAPFALLTLSAVAALAQAPLPVLRVEPATGSSILFIRNAAAQPPLTAFLIELVHYPGSYYQLWEDDIDSQAIAPDTEKRIPISNMTVGAVPNYVKVTAAIYADGTSGGVPEKITQLIERRRYTLQTTRELITRLDKAHAAGSSATSAATGLKQWADSLPALTRSTQNSQIAINQSAAKTLIADTATQLGAHSLEETLSSLHASEAALAAGKPTL
jgi:hypothetical protein